MTGTASLAVGDRLKQRFVLEALIGGGGMGTVYRARDLRQEEARERNPYVAVKVLNPELSDSEDAYIALQRETRKARSLAHPNIITVYDFDRDDQHVYMTMECLQGQPLDEWIALHAPLRLEDCWFIIRGIADALDHAHSRGIVHCDFKPSNVFVCDDDTVKVIDFGIARACKKPGQHQQTTVFDLHKLEAYTPAYASCELIEGLEARPADDVYAFACVIYELLTGRHPFNCERATVARAQALSAAMPSALNSRQWGVLKAALAFDSDQRCSIQSLIIDLAPGKRLRTWRAPELAALLILATGAGSLAIYQYLGKAPRLAGPGTVAQQAAVAPSEAEFVVPAHLQDEVNALLEQADIHLEIGYLIEPRGMNALEAYRKALDLAPDHPRALAGLDQLAEHFHQQARSARRQNNLRKALILADRGLQIRPGHPQLVSLVKDLERQGG